MDLLSETFKCKVGISDHTLGIGVGIAAIALGARVIEKHFTLSRSDGGADAAFSLEPNEFKSLVLEGKAALDSLGQTNWSIQATEEESRRLRRSLYIVQNVKKGDVVSRHNLRPIRPGGGCSPKYLNFLLGKKFTEDFDSGTPMHTENVE
jgi:N-acetylneuraminate synthase